MKCVFNAIASCNGKFNLKVKTYFKNSVVCLSSIIEDNIDKCIVTNVTEIDEDIKKLINFFNIKVIYCPFDLFNFEDKFPWNLAFYKCCALKFIVENYDYDDYLLCDTDIIFIKKLDLLWEENDGLMLFCLPYSINHQDRRKFLNEIKNLSKSKMKYYGGEIICGDRSKLKSYINDCYLFYLKMKNENIMTERGDEFIWSYVANKYKISDANPFIKRCWTGRSYSVSSSFYYDETIMLHLPNEKERGFLIAFNKLKKGRKVNVLKNRRLFNLPSSKKPFIYYKFVDLKKIFRRR